MAVQVRLGLFNEQTPLFPRPVYPQERDEGFLAGGGILAQRLAGESRVALHIKQVVGDLEG